MRSTKARPRRGDALVGLILRDGSQIAKIRKHHIIRNLKPLAQPKTGCIFPLRGAINKTGCRVYLAYRFTPLPPQRGTNALASVTGLDVEVSDFNRKGITGTQGKREAWIRRGTTNQRQIANSRTPMNEPKQMNTMPPRTHVGLSHIKRSAIQKHDPLPRT